MEKFNFKRIAFITIGLIGFLWLVSYAANLEDNGGIDLMKTGPRIEAKEAKYDRAKDISTPDGFINTDPITISELIGKKVILVDFWTYSCINCQRTIPYLNAWHEKYSDEGLVILGIHTPEFDFEKEIENVKAAVKKYGLKHPIVLDNDFSTWHTYGNRYWPRKYLIDIDGFIVYDRIGEGGYEETEAKIKEALTERSMVMGEEMSKDKDSTDINAQEVDYSKIITREIYFGSERLSNLQNLPANTCLDGVCTYIPPDSLKLSSYSLGGTWTTDKEKVTLESDSGSIKLRFSANTVNIVAGAVNKVSAQVYLDGNLINDQNRGDDIAGTRVEISAHDLYNLVNLQGEYGEHLLEIKFQSKGVSIFTFTFG